MTTIESNDGDLIGAIHADHFHGVGHLPLHVHLELVPHDGLEDVDIYLSVLVRPLLVQRQGVPIVPAEPSVFEVMCGAAQ